MLLLVRVGTVQITAGAWHGLSLSWNRFLGTMKSKLSPCVLCSLEISALKETCHLSCLSLSLSSNHVWALEFFPQAGLVSLESVLLTQLSLQVLFWNENKKFSLGFSSKLLSQTYFIRSLAVGGQLGTWLAISKANILSHLASDPCVYSLFLWHGGKEEWWVLSPKLDCNLQNQILRDSS